MNVLIYCRISTQSQDLSSQIISLRKICDENKWTVKHILTDTGTGHDHSKRNGLLRLKKIILNEHIDKIICTELSRISRNRVFLEKFISTIDKKNIDIWIGTEKNSLRNLDINFQISYASLETNLIRKRVERGYYHFIQNGGKVGRKVGWVKTDESILEENKSVIKLLKSGISVREIMKLTKKSTNTIMKVRKILNMSRTKNN